MTMFCFINPLGPFCKFLGCHSLFSFVPFKAVLGDFGWAPQRDSNGDSLSGAQPFLGTITIDKEPDDSFSFVKVAETRRAPLRKP